MATTSKYIHHRAAATATPSTDAATIGQEIGRAATPMPIETSDSPRAMMMIRPCRSAQWAAEKTCHPSAPMAMMPP